MECNQGCECAMPSDRELSELINGTEVYLSNLGYKLYNNLIYGFKIAPDIEKNFDLFSKGLKVLKGLYQKVVDGGVSCLSCEKIQRLIEGIKVGLPRDCRFECRQDILIDKTGFDAWALLNKYCVPYEIWERSAHAFCELLEIEYTVTKQDKCTIAYEIVRKKLNCDTFVEISKVSRDCKIDYTYTVNVEDCKIEFEALVKSYNCAFSFESYVNIVKCGIDISLIRRVLDCGYCVDYSVQESCPIIVLTNDTLPFTSFQVRNEQELWQRLLDMNIA